MPHDILSHVFTCWDDPLSQMSDILLRFLRYSWDGLHNRPPQVFSQKSNPLELDLEAEEALLYSLDIQSIFLCLSLSVTLGHLPLVPWRSVDMKPEFVPHSIPTTWVSRKSRYRWAISLSGMKQGILTILQRISA